MQKILLDVEEDCKTHPWGMMRNIQFFLPKNIKFTELVVKHYHKLVFHNAVRETLNQIRIKSWIKKPRNY